MLKRILVPLDGSAFTSAVTQKAIRMAERSGAELFGLTIIDEPTIRRPEPQPMGAGNFLERRQEKLLAEAQTHVREHKKAFLETCAAHKVKAHVIERTGDPATVVIAEAHKMDLVVMGQISHFRHVTQDEPCETFQTVLKGSPRPMVIVPKRLEAGKGVWIATDGSIAAARAIQVFELMGLLGERTAHVISVDKEETRARDKCTDVAEFLEAHGARVDKTPVASSQHPWDALQKRLQEEQPELMVMGAYGTSGLKDFFMGSMTRKFVENAPFPLFVFH